MTTEKKPRRRSSRRQNYLRVPIGVSLRQQHLRSALNTNLRPAKARMVAMKMKMKRVKKFNEKKRVELIEMDARVPQLIAERMQALQDRMRALEECVWAQAWCDAMEALLFAPSGSGPPLSPVEH